MNFEKIKFHFVSFKDDFIKSMFNTIYNDKLNNNIQNKNNTNNFYLSKNTGKLFIFPNHYSKNKAIEIFKDFWELEIVEFLTMEELKNLLVSEEIPSISEDKRKILLYSCFFEKGGQKLKKYFKIKNFFNSINFLNNFFNFFDELSDENIKPESILNKDFTCQNPDFFSEWQIEYLKNLLELLKIYKTKLEEKGFIDKIFLYKNFENKIKNNINSYFSRFNKVFIVNQYYFSKIEKIIINEITKLKNLKVNFFLHLPENLSSFYDKENLEFKSIETISDDFLNGIKENFKLKYIEIYKNKTPITSLFTMLNKSKDETPDLIINNNVFAEKFHPFLSYNTFVKNIVFPITTTKLYKTLESLLLLFKNHELTKSNEILIYIESFIDCLNISEFVSFFNIENSLELVRKLSILKQKGFLYLSLSKNSKYNINIFNKENFDKTIPVLEENFDKIISFLNEFYFLSSFKDFKTFLLKFIVQNENKDNINFDFKLKEEFSEFVFDLFSNSLIDIENIFNLGLIEEKIFSKLFIDKREETHRTFSLFMLKLLLNYLKSKTISIQNPIFKNQIQFTTLNNTRNISYNGNVFVYNFVESILPSEKKQQFLLSEEQRKKLGLKTYKQIRDREKYYFIRLIFNSKKVYFFTIDDNENFIPSSFLEEIMLFSNLMNSKNFETNIIKLKYYSDEESHPLYFSQDQIFKTIFDFDTVSKNKEKNGKKDHRVNFFEKENIISDNNNSNNQSENKKLKKDKIFTINFNRNQPIKFNEFIYKYHKFENPDFAKTNTKGWLFSYSKIKDFIASPPIYFLKYLTSLHKIDYTTDLTISHLTLGNIAHYIFKNMNAYFFDRVNKIINKNSLIQNKSFKDLFPDFEIKLNYFTDNIFVNEKESIFYKVPENISKNYFYEFIYPVLKEKANDFYRWFFINNIKENFQFLKQNGFLIIVEGLVYNYKFKILKDNKINDISNAKKLYLSYRYFTGNYNKLDLFKLNVYITGIPDLAFIYKTDNHSQLIIIDYKTGKAHDDNLSNLQLELYERLIKSIFKDFKLKNTHSYFHHIFDNNSLKPKDKIKENKFDTKLVEFANSYKFELKLKSDIDEDYSYVFFPDN